MSVSMFFALVSTHRSNFFRVLLPLILTSIGSLVTRAEEVQQPAFTLVIDDSPLPIKLLPKEVVTEAVKKFYETGENPYKADASALDAGKKLYTQWCQSCHMPDGSGRIGPSFIGETHHYPRFTADNGMFEIVYGGATGAMQGFGNRLTQDQILEVMAYVRSLKK
jgi:cytochrome c-L